VDGWDKPGHDEIPIINNSHPRRLRRVSCLRLSRSRTTSGRTGVEAMATADSILALNVLAIVLAPIVALWIGGILQRRSDTHRSKLTLFGTLVGLRHEPLSIDAIRALNLIDAVFADDPAVREAWTRYYTALNDANMNIGPGFSIREERRRDLLLAMVKALKLKRKISSADLLRTYLPTFMAESTHLAVLQRMQQKAAVEEDLQRRGIQFPQWPVPEPQTAVAPPPLQPNGPAA
jgi:hypothetical protein